MPAAPGVGRTLDGCPVAVVYEHLGKVRSHVPLPDIDRKFPDILLAKDASESVLDRLPFGLCGFWVHGAEDRIGSVRARAVEAGQNETGGGFDAAIGSVDQQFHPHPFARSGEASALDRCLYGIKNHVQHTSFQEIVVKNWK